MSVPKEAEELGRAINGLLQEPRWKGLATPEMVFVLVSTAASLAVYVGATPKMFRHLAEESFALWKKRVAMRPTEQ